MIKFSDVSRERNKSKNPQTQLISGFFAFFKTDPGNNPGCLGGKAGELFGVLSARLRALSFVLKGMQAIAMPASMPYILGDSRTIILTG